MLLQFINSFHRHFYCIVFSLALSLPASVPLCLASWINICWRFYVYTYAYSNYNPSHFTFVLFPFRTCRTKIMARFDQLWLDCISFFYTSLLIRLQNNGKILFWFIFCVSTLFETSQEYPKILRRQKNMCFEGDPLKLIHIQSSLITTYDSRTIRCGSRKHKKKKINAKKTQRP